MNICDSEGALILLKVIMSFIKFITVIIPILLIVIGMMDFFKTITSNDPDVSKTMKIFLKRLISAVLVFFVIPIVTMVMDIASPNSPASICLQKINGTVEIITENEENEEASVDKIEENKIKCEEKKKTYIKQPIGLIPSDLKNTELYLESGNHAYLCVDGEVE